MKKVIIILINNLKNKCVFVIQSKGEQIKYRIRYSKTARWYLLNSIIFLWKQLNYSCIQTKDLFQVFLQTTVLCLSLIYDKQISKYVSVCSIKKIEELQFLHRIDKNETIQNLFFTFYNKKNLPMLHLPILSKSNLS